MEGGLSDTSSRLLIWSARCDWMLGDHQRSNDIERRKYLARPIALAESHHPLDHHIWNALPSVRSAVAEGDDRARRYPAAMAPFAATRDTSQASYAAVLPLVSCDDRVALSTSYAFDAPKRLTI